MIFMRKLPEVEELVQEFCLSSEQKILRQKRIDEVKSILSGNDKRKMLVIGPCSADREDAILEYTYRLAEVQEEVRDSMLIVPRIYTSKPRTTGVGYKGILHNPDTTKVEDDLLNGIISMRRMHYRVIQETGFFCADEMLYPEISYYVLDLLGYVTVGARTVEDQAHRMTASGVQIPVGLKNPMDGNIEVLINSISAAQKSHVMVYRGWEVKTEGNEYAHAILRGYTDRNNKMHPNYHYEDLTEIHDVYLKSNLQNPSIIVDCNHGNSKKRYEEQLRIAKEVFEICETNESINSMVKGLMVESYLEDGAQLPGENVFGRSITDGCIGWKKTEKLIHLLTDGK